MAATPVVRHTSVCLAAVLVVLVALLGGAHSQGADVNLFRNLYDSIEKMVIPPYNSGTAGPTQVILFEMPGLAINRDDYDPSIWAGQNFRGRQPEAVAAAFVDRLPYYTSTVFADSGARISDVWSTFMYQYIIPIVDDPIQTAKVDAARLALANGTLLNRYTAASDAYSADYSKFTNFRGDCLGKQPGGVCSAEGVLYRERLKRKWFTLEVARRDIAAAESKIIALQVQDLKNIFADALYTFASNERVDMGGDGFGQSYYLTFFTPSNFWRWWPTSGPFDYSTFADGSLLTIPLPASATITTQPSFGRFQLAAGGNYTYLPNAGFTGNDLVRYSYTSLVAGQNRTIEEGKVIQVIGSDVAIADAAFVTVAASAQASTTTSRSFSSTVTTTTTASASFGWWWSVSGSGSSTSTSTVSSSATSTVSSSSRLEFSLAKVSIFRQWLDLSLLAYYPVAIRNLAAKGWSDGTVTPATGVTQFKFKLLPTAFLVARNIIVETGSDAASDVMYSASSNSQGSSGYRVGFGPFFSGSARTSSSSSANYKESVQRSSTNRNSLTIRGPQVIGWLCTPIPAFPTSDETGVRTWEAQQVARQLASNPSVAANIVTANTATATPTPTPTPSSSSSTTTKTG
jgi:hypothetical protein